MISQTTARRRSALIRLSSACAALLIAAAVPAAGEAYREDAVKAAFLYRFTAFIEWPQPALTSGEFRFAVLGAPRVADELTQLVAGKPVASLPARVRQVGSPADAADSHVLYVGPGYSGDLARLVESLGTRPVLVVVDHPRGLDDGGTINFLAVDQRIRFEVSAASAQRAGLRISSQLLAVAVRVRPANTEAAAR
jgi:hypothetical protein